MIRQEILNIIDLFTAQPIINFYENIFDNIDLSFIPEFIESKFGPKGYSQHALTRAFIVMWCEHFREITLLLDFLNLNLKIAQLCGFDIIKPLHSYTVFQRFVKKFYNGIFKIIMKNQVNKLIDLDVISNSIVSVDSTPILANTKYNNSKCFSKKKFCKDNPKSDIDCALGVHTANNENTEKNYTFYWGYKNLVMCDAKSGLPIYELTLTGEKADISMLIDFLDQVDSWFSLGNSKILADKGFDSKKNYNHIKNYLHAQAFIAKNKRNNKKITERLPCGNPLCEAGLAMHKDGKQYLKDSIKIKYCCHFKNSKDDSKCPCNHPKYKNGCKNRGCIKYESIGTDYRSSVDEKSTYFKKYYSYRTQSERYNSRFKNLNLEDASVRNMQSVSNLNTLGHICLLTVAIASILNNNNESIRSLRRYKRNA